MIVTVMELVNHEVLMAKDNHHILIVNADLIFIFMIVQSSLVFYRRMFQYSRTYIHIYSFFKISHQYLELLIFVCAS